MQRLIGEIREATDRKTAWQEAEAKVKQINRKTFTPKQTTSIKKNGKLYWCDREGMRVMRSNLNDSRIETLVETGHGDSDRRDQTKWGVGITVARA